MIGKKLLVGLVVMLTFFLMARAVQATIIGFEGIAPSGGSALLPASQTIDGYNVSFGRSGAGLVLDSAYPGMGSLYPDSGSDHLRVAQLGFNMTITDPLGTAFSLKGLDASDRNAYYTGLETFTVTGLDASGTIIGTTFTTPLSTAATPSTFHTFSLNPGWGNLISVTIGGTTRVSYDNIELGIANPDDGTIGPSPGAVPEPTSLALWSGLGIMGLIAVRRRRKAA
jgi:hypothetical protein